MYFDPEWEHVFLRLRFGEHYRFLREPGLDRHRLALFRLAMHLSLVAGPLRLLDGDFPDREPMLQIAAYNTRQACLDAGVTGLAGEAGAGASRAAQRRAGTPRRR